MTTDHVTHPVALKEAGFDLPTHAYYPSRNGVPLDELRLNDYVTERVYDFAAPGWLTAAEWIWEQTIDHKMRVLIRFALDKCSLKVLDAEGGEDRQLYIKTTWETREKAFLKAIELITEKEKPSNS